MTEKREYVAGEPDPEAEAYVEGAGLAPEPDDEVNPPDEGEEVAGGGEPDTEETLARAGGWCPREEWRGDPARWVDARTFNDTASPARMRERILRIEDDYSKRIDRIDRISTAAIERLKKDHEDQLKSLREQREENVLLEAEANGAEAAKRLRAQWDGYIAEQEKNGPEIPEPAQPAVEPEPQQQIPPETAAWSAKHPEYKTDQEFGGAAFWAMDKISKEMAGRPLAEQFAELDRRMAKRFPEYYPKESAPPPNANGNARQVAAPPANARAMDGVRISTKREGSYSSRLNDVERRMGRRFVERGDFPSLEAYAKDLIDNA